MMNQNLMQFNLQELIFLFSGKAVINQSMSVRNVKASLIKLSWQLGGR